MYERDPCSLYPLANTDHVNLVAVCVINITILRYLLVVPYRAVVMIREIGNAIKISLLL